MKTAKVEETKPFQNAHMVDARKILENPGAEVIHMALTPGQALKKHTTPIDVFFYILEAEVSGNRQRNPRSAKRHSHRQPQRYPHLLRNTGDGVFRFLVVKLPKTA
jgi:quercetin dioxygenase-like cupin family protein